LQLQRQRKDSLILIQWEWITSSWRTTFSS